MRHHARELALQISYQRSQIRVNSLGEAWHFNQANLSKKDLSFCCQLLDAAEKHQTDIDKWVNKALNEWRVSRLQKTLKAVFRVGVAELLLFQETDYQVVMNEWLEICREYAGEPAVKLCNAVLDQIRKEQILSKQKS